MGARRLSLILLLCLLPSLSGCGAQNGAPAAAAPGKEALAAIAPQPGAERNRLASAIDRLFTDSPAGETRALLIMREGRIVAERYGEGYGKGSRLTGWSMTKSITAVLVGMLVADGRLRLDETAPVPAWQRTGDPRGEITLRQLLQMRSGLRHTEAGDPPYRSDEVRMLFLDGRDDMAAYAEAQPLEALAGRKFEYSSASSVILADIATRMLTDSPDPAARRRAMSDYMRTRLFEPLAMQSMLAEFDAAGTLVGSSLIHGTARDWAKFGELLRNGGAVRGAQLLPHGWIDFMIAPSPRNPGYGAQLWLNRPQADGSGALFPGAPASLFACVGHLGQYVLVSPRQKLVVVRLGKSDEEERPVLRRQLADIVALFPALERR